MMRSMFSGVSGLKTHQTRMDVIGNNIANVNTVGFKSGRVTFQEVFSQTLRGASAPDANVRRAGTNPMQIGLGTGVASIDTIMTNGSTQRTDNPLDLSIEGDGFFIVRSSTADSYKFTRAGNFSIDAAGNLNLNGLSVYGWDAKNATKNPDGSVTFNTEASIEPINLGGNKLQIAPESTTYVNLAGNLSSKNDSTTFTVPVYVYDTQGNKHKIDIQFDRVSGATTGTWSSQWNWKLNPGSGLVGNFSGSINFGPDGIINASSEISASGPLGVRLVSGTTDQWLVSGFTFTTTPDTGTISFTMNFMDLTQWATDGSSAKVSKINGTETGDLVTLNVGSDGIITGVYSNGEQKALAMIGVATFPNTAGLKKVGNNLFDVTTNSGDFEKAVKPGTAGAGSLSPGTLEMSNVDLSREFTEMIVTQRGFQANSRIITTSDEMLQELVNLKR